MSHCGSFVWGLVSYYFVFVDCKFNCHKKCAPHVAKDCQGETTSQVGGSASPLTNALTVHYIYSICDRHVFITSVSYSHNESRTY